MTLHTGRTLRVGSAALLFGACVLAGACGSDTPASSQPVEPAAEQQFDGVEVETWVKPERWPGYWAVYADVREFIGEERWAALDTEWMADRAQADLATVTANHDEYADMFVLSGLWRLGMLRDEVLAALAQREPVAEWPIVASERRAGHGWRIRVELWLRAQPMDDRQALPGQLEMTWQEAVAAADMRAASRVLEVRQTWLGETDVPAAWLADVATMVRESLGVYLREYEKDWRDGRPPAGVIGLMERCGVPDGVDLPAVVAAAQHYDREMADESIPLPHPYELHIRVLRLVRLAESTGD